ncbi:AMP-binding protein [Pseudomonas fluorescens]|uniref:AMP-binding protein n=1 Tax=Pseudomonas fluorescens TaxID=294 RepID=UPI00177C4747|nr:AMP-binding protein [Pseudomonas fluorescens]
MNFIQHMLDEIQSKPDAIRIIDCSSNRPEFIDGKTLYQRVMQLGEHLVASGLDQDAVIGIVMSNSADWVIADLACLAFGYTTLPLPLGFSRYQAEFLANRCSAFLVDTKGKQVLEEKWELATLNAICVKEVYQHAHPHPTGTRQTRSADWVCKIIHTSGTTSRPKGVKQSLGGLSVMLHSLLERVPRPIHKHYLSLVPLSLLIEQVTAVYLPLLSGGKIQFLPPTVPLIGEPNVDMQALITRVIDCGATAMTVPPVMLEALLARVENDTALASYFKTNLHITAGGAPVSARALERLERLGITVYEGYGLSENGSVISVSTAQARKIGSVGKPLAHVEVRINSEGRIEIRSASIFAGYSWVDPSACQVGADGWLDTGDLGQIDEDGFLYVIGRAKNLICLPNGRNVSPEQVEMSFREQPGVKEAILYLGTNAELTVALVVSPHFDVEQVKQWSKEWFSEVERPQELRVLHEDAPLLQALATKTLIEKRRILTAAAAEEHEAASTH